MWLRLFATAFDWWTLFAASLGLAVGGTAAGNGVLSLLGRGPVPDWGLPLFYLLALLITGILYYLIVAPRLGATPGKWLFGLRTECVAGAILPSPRRQWAREFLLKPLLLLGSFLVLQSEAVRAIFPLAPLMLPVVPFLHGMFVHLTRPDGRLLHDRLLGTRVVRARLRGGFPAFVEKAFSGRGLAFQALLLATLGIARYGESLWAHLRGPDGLYRDYREAIVRIVTYERGTYAGIGTGFFVSSAGHLVTNEHVMAGGLAPGGRVEFILANGKVVQRYWVGGCSPHWELDLCVLQLDHKPARWFVEKPEPVVVGDEVYVVGHPHDFDFTLSRGLVSGIRSPPGLGRRIQFNAPISPGNSGGPMFNGRGELVGVVASTFGDYKSQMINFGVDGRDVFTFLREQKAFLEPEAHRKRQQRQLQALGERMAREVFGPAYEAIDRGRPLNHIQFSPQYLEFKGRKYKIWLPFNIASGCRAYALGDRAALHCPRPAGGGEMSVMLETKPRGYLEQFRALKCRQEARRGIWLYDGGLVCSGVKTDPGNPERSTRVVAAQPKGSNLVFWALGTANHPRATGLFFHGVNLASLTFEEAGAK